MSDYRKQITDEKEFLDIINEELSFITEEMKKVKYIVCQYIINQKTSPKPIKEVQSNKKYRFYLYENNPEGSDYCFCQRPCDSNMSLHCFLDNGEILGFMSESLVGEHPEIKEIDMDDFMHHFVKPLIRSLKQKDDIIKEVKKFIEDNMTLYDEWDKKYYWLEPDEYKELLSKLDKGE